MTFDNCYLGMSLLYKRWLGLGKVELDTPSMSERPARRLRTSCGRDVRLAEVIAFEQQRRAMVFRHRVSKAVAEVELRRMPSSLAVPREGGECRLRFPLGDRNCTDRRHPKE